MTIPLTQETIKIGMKVRCIYDCGKIGKIGTVMIFERKCNLYSKINIFWDDLSLDMCDWESCSSFESIEGICIQDCCSTK